MGDRELSDDECIAVYQNWDKAGGKMSKRKLQEQLFGNAGTPQRRRLEAIFARAEAIMQGNDADIHDQLDDIDTDILSKFDGGDD